MSRKALKRELKPHLLSEMVAS